MLARDGFQIGNHTFTHADLAQLPAWERSLQVSLNQTAITGVSGKKPRLLRPPYSSTPNAVTPTQEKAWASLARSGYVIALSNFDTQDWSLPGVRSIVRAARITYSGWLAVKLPPGLGRCSRALLAAARQG